MAAITDISTLLLPDFVQGVKYSVQGDAKTGSERFGLSDFGRGSGRRLVLCDVTLSIVGLQLQALESFLVNGLNNAADKFLSNYLSETGVKLGIVKIVEGKYSVKTDNRNHLVSFTLELPTYPERPTIPAFCSNSHMSDIYWTSSDFTYLSPPTRWESAAQTSIKTLSATPAIASPSFRPSQVQITVFNSSISPVFTAEVLVRATSIFLGATVVVGGGTHDFTFNGESITINAYLEWPVGEYGGSFFIDDIRVELSSPQNDVDIYCIGFVE